MLFRKKLISNFIWILAMIVLVVMGAQYAFLYGIDFLFADENSYLGQFAAVSYTAMDTALLIWIVTFIGICVGAFFIVRAISKAIYRRVRTRKHVVNIFQILLACAVFLIGILYRGYLLMSTSGAVILADSTYYDAAAAMLEDDYAAFSELSAHGGTHAYLMLLDFAMRFVGDRMVAAVLLQIVIQVVTILLAFAIFRHLVNYTCGLVTALGLSVSTLYTSKLFTSSPGCFIAMLVIVSIYLVSCLLKSEGGRIKIVLGAVFGLICGYMLYLDASVILCLIPIVFCLIYEAGNPEKKGFLPAYLLMIGLMAVGLGLSFVVSGGFDPGEIAYSAQNWLDATMSTLLPEFSLMDNSAGDTAVLQCLIMVGLSAMTCMGTVGRDRIEYEFPWVMMFVAALTPLTRIGYLHDNTTSLIIYMMLTGTGVSAMTHVMTRADRIVVPAPAAEEVLLNEDGTPSETGIIYESLDENEYPADAGTYPELSDAQGGGFDANGYPAEAGAAGEDFDAGAYPELTGMQDGVFAHAEPETFEAAVEEDAGTYAETVIEDAAEEAEIRDAKETSEADYAEHADNALHGASEAVIVPDDDAGESGDQVEPETMADDRESGVEDVQTVIIGEEELPTSIPWASIRDLDDDDSLNILKDEETGEDTVLTSGNRNYEVVVEGADFVTEEMFMPDEDEEESGQASGADVAADARSQEFDRRTMQVDDLPGMIPNPLPLPKKKAYSEMDYDLDDEDVFMDDFDDDYDDAKWGKDDYRYDDDEGDDDFDM